MKPPSGKDWIIITVMGIVGASTVCLVGVLARIVQSWFQQMTENLTNWKQFRLKLNLGMLVSIIGVVSVVVWQGLMIRAQIDDNSDAVDEMVYAIEDLAGAVSLANELDNRTTVLFGEIDSLRDQYQDQADVWVEISTQAEQIDTIRAEARILRQDIESTWNQQNEFRMEVVGQVGEFESARNSLTDLQWKVDDLDRRVAEQFGVDLGSEHQDYGWQITDLVRQVAELQGRMNSANDMEWKVDDLERQLNEVKDSVGYLLMVAEQSYWNVNQMKTWIDQDLCTGDGLCEEICPSIFYGHDDGLFYVKEAGSDRPKQPTHEMAQAVQVPDDLVEAVIEAAEECPGECIFVEAD